jgi:hypothetical protein
LPLLVACSDSSDSILDSSLCSGTEVNPERLFIQQLGSDRAIIKWRGNSAGAEEASTLCYGQDQDAMPIESLNDAVVTATGHSEVLISGLEADTTYFYSVGGAASAPDNRHFTTAPASGSLPGDGNIRIWIVGDSGVGGEDKPEAAQVRDGFLSYVDNSGGEVADLFLMLGDNAYRQGTDNEHQKAVFDVYPSILEKTPLWPTIGNHEMGTLGVSTSPDPDSYTVLGEDDIDKPDAAPDSPMPYLNIFTLPTSAETGGLASGTEQYYSFDYSNVHIASLDSQLAIRDDAQRAAMLQWLIDDLSANTLDWTIVIFHHPPYTKGSHDSDEELGGIDQPIFAIREEFTPVFEDYGVDLAYAGHSHIYERSYYIQDHTGLSPSFDAATMAELNGSGAPANGQGDETYTQLTSSGTDDKVVYTVAGNGGKVTFTSAGFPHPAHFFSELTLGSVVIDLTETTLDAKFIGINGDVLDSFTMTR